MHLQASLRQGFGVGLAQRCSRGRPFWDGGIDIRLGDQVNGFVAEETFALVAGIGPWLQQAIAHFYPDSAYARALDQSETDGHAAPLPDASGRHACPLPALRRTHAALAGM